MSKKYIVTLEVRVGVQAENEKEAKLNASVGILDVASAERLGVEWFGCDVVSCIEDSY